MSKGERLKVKGERRGGRAENKKLKGEGLAGTRIFFAFVLILDSWLLILNSWFLTLNFRAR